MLPVKDSIKKIVTFSFHPIINRVKKFKNKYNGQSCYIIGDGISLKWFDLKCFSDLPTIGLVKLSTHKYFDHLNVSQLLMIGPFSSYPVAQNGYIQKLKYNPNYRICRNIIKRKPQLNFFTHISNYPLLAMSHSNISYVFRKLPGGLGNNLDNFNYFSSASRASITLAIYMGFHKIYLVGFDYTHNPARGFHWYEKGKGVIDPDLGNYFEKDFILAAKKYVDIINITLDGQSKHLDYITYKDFTGGDPVYRENTEIIEKVNLKELSRWTGYNIY